MVSWCRDTAVPHVHGQHLGGAELPVPLELPERVLRPVPLPRQAQEREGGGGGRRHRQEQGADAGEQGIIRHSA